MVEPAGGMYSDILRRLFGALGLAIFAAAASVQGASAQQLMGQDVEKIGDFRVGGFAGVFIPNSANWKGSGTLNGLPVSASGQLSLKTGSAIGGLFGYAFNQHVNIDLDLGYVSSSFDKFDGLVSIAGLGNFNGPMPLAGHTHTFAGFINTLVTPFGTETPITPYIGAGPGLAHSTAKLQSLSVGGATIPVNSTSSETDFAADFVLGFDVKVLPQSMPQLELGIGYEFVWINAKHLGSGAGIQANTGSVSGHIIGLVLEYRFKGLGS